MPIQATCPPPRESCVRGADRASVDKSYRLEREARRLRVSCYREFLGQQHEPNAVESLWAETWAEKQNGPQRPVFIIDCYKKHDN
jgi:hypothetical protein